VQEEEEEEDNDDDDDDDVGDVGIVISFVGRTVLSLLS